MRHVAYVFDALIYYMRSGTDSDTDVIREADSKQETQVQKYRLRKKKKENE
jgi:E3 ubiquitin-protein ligase EDD1